jgi:flagellar basal-body rod protein FlgC
MDYFKSFAISASGLAAEKLRLETAALNLANSDTTAAPGSVPYQSLEVVGTASQAFASYLSGEQQNAASAAVAATVQPRLLPPRMVHDPAHPHADANGFVARANVDSLSEMVTILRATRAYEANIKALNAAKAMAQQALEIGSGK